MEVLLVEDSAGDARLTQEAFRDPTIILTTSDSADDVRYTCQHKANCYLVKPVHLDEFERVVKIIDDFWLTKVRVPAQTSH